MSTKLRYLGKYELREWLGSGAQGEVWKAYDVQLHRFVAIKQLRVQTNSRSAIHFEREARFIARLHHPNIVQIHDFQFEVEPESQTCTAYMVIDFIDGPTLAEYIHKTSHIQHYPSATDVVSIFTAISMALDYAHQKGMLHRDIKPANIMLDTQERSVRPMGEPILTDFGIARLQDNVADTTRGQGTPLYVSPEQAQGSLCDKHSDLYSLGIILYEMMAGSPPFTGKSVMAVLMQHYLKEPQPPEQLNPNISPELSAVILKSISKDPENRFDSASAMTIALAKALNVPVSPELYKATATPSSSHAETVVNPLSLPPEVAPLIQKTYSRPSSVNNRPQTFLFPGDNKQTHTTPLRIRPRKILPMLRTALLVVMMMGLISFILIGLNKIRETSNTNTMVGQVVFSNSQNQAGPFDTVTMTLKGITDDTTDGKKYYAWLETHDFDDGANVHWPFTVQHDNIVPSFYRQQNLLTPLPYLLLITRQSNSSFVPSFTLSDRLYYANIRQLDKNHTTFAIFPCPQSEDNNICLS